MQPSSRVSFSSQLCSLPAAGRYRTPPAQGPCLPFPSLQAGADRCLAPALVRAWPILSRRGAQAARQGAACKQISR